VSLSELPPQINSAHAAVGQHLRGAVEHACICGRLLRQAKERVGHGGYLIWLAANCHISERQARNYMLIAARWDKVKSALSADLTLAQALRIARGEGIDRFELPELTPKYRWTCFGTHNTCVRIEPVGEPYYYVAIRFDCGGPDQHVIEPSKIGYHKDYLQLVLRGLAFIPVAEWRQEEFNPSDADNWSIPCIEYWRARRLRREHLTDQEREIARQVIDRHREMNAAAGEDS
jgi:Protein of unknown function (DUF3102).